MSDRPNPEDEGAEGNAPEASQPRAGSRPPPEKNTLSRRAPMALAPWAAADLESTRPRGGLAGYLHAFRRRWFLAIGLGIVGGGAAAVAAWFATTTNYTASALIRIAADEEHVAFKVDEGHSSFDIYKSTQMQLLTSDFVLIAALRKVPNLNVVRREEDPVRWLARSLQVDAPGNAEILRVGLTTTDWNEGAAIVNAVVEAYMTDVVDKERANRNQRIEKLEKIHSEQQALWREKWTQLKKLAEQLGSSDIGALSLKQQFALQQLAEMRNDLSRIKGELQQAQDAFEATRAKLDAIKAKREKSATPNEIENAVNNDQEYVRQQEALATLDDQFSEVKSVVKEGGGLGKSLNDRYRRLHKDLEGQLEKRRKQLADHLKTLKSGDPESLETEAKELQSKLARLKVQKERAEQDVEDQRKQTEMYGNSSIDVEMTRTEKTELEKVLTTIADQQQQLQVELGSQARINIIQPAAPAAAPDKTSRLQNTIVSGALGFLAPICLLLWWDVRGRRINSLEDISEGLGLRVIGTVPHMGDSTVSLVRPNSRRQRQMQIRLDHSIDGIAAKLFLRSDAKNARVVLVSSATRGEGKSTLSIQLAKRLARTGAATLLVDFDLRKPSLHHAFDIPRGPGLSEFLRGEGDLGLIVQQTAIEHLSVLTAGSPFRDSLGVLSNGVTRSLFEKARGEYEFVVVDGSPILPVVDALLTSQHVDSVILSVRRDVSQAPRIQAACEQLAAFGVEELVAVLTGTNEDLYYYGDDGNHEHVAQMLDESPKPR